MSDGTPTKIWSYRDASPVHLAVGGLVCLFVLSPALFTPFGFGPDYSNHLWLVWQQGLAIAENGHPTIYLQQGSGIFEPFYGFYGGTLYAAVGAICALVGTDRTYAVYVASYGVSFAMAYGGMWWLGRQVGLSRWVSHLPAFVVVTAAYYLTDAYARGAWPELVALSAVPLFIAGGAYLLTKAWKWGAVALFLIATVFLSGSHNITLLWALLVIGPCAIVALVASGSRRPAIRRIVMVAGLIVLGAGVNAWFLVLDLTHSSDTQAWAQSAANLKYFGGVFYFDNLGTVLDPLRRTPGESTTFGLTIAAPVMAFVLGLIASALAWPSIRSAGRALRALWLILMMAIAVLVVLMVMPSSWWTTMGSPFTEIQFPYRLAGWLLVAIALQLAISLRFARGLSGTRRRIVVVLGVALVAATVAQAAAQLYPSGRLDETANAGIRPRENAFVNGPTVAPPTFYDPWSYADSAEPIVDVPPSRQIDLPAPAPGGIRSSVTVKLGRNRAPMATNIAAGPYVVQIAGMRQVGRTAEGFMVVAPEGRRSASELSVRADAGATGAVGTVVSLLCLLGSLGLVGFLAVRSGLTRRRSSPT